MSRRPVVAVALLAVAVATTLPAHAAKAKPKPKPIRGSYTVNLLPDPSPNVTNQLGKEGCGVLPQSQHKRPFRVPAAGKLQVVLDSPNPTGNATVGTDWDLYILDSDGVLNSSNGATSHEETTDRFKKKDSVTIWVCNLAGQPSGKVSFTFTYA